MNDIIDSGIVYKNYLPNCVTLDKDPKSGGWFIVPITKWWIVQYGTYPQFIKKMVRLGQITWRDYDMEIGRYFNIPMCCIENFLKLNEEGVEVYKYMTELYEEDDKYYGYVRCKKCRGIK